MPNVQKYRNTMNLGREDVNKHGWKVGQIVHLAREIIGNRYEYCGYAEYNVPAGARARITGVKQTTLNAKILGGIGDVYIDFECLDHANPDGTPITCGNRHSFTMAEANSNFAMCPDGSGEPGYIREHRDHPGREVWFSLHADRVADHPQNGYVRFLNRKVVDPVTAQSLDASMFV